MYLITGSTGNIGRPLVERLHKEGHEVRALVRDPSRADLLPDGIDIAIGNLDDADSVAAALRGVDSVFLLHAGPGTTQTQIMIDAARSAEVNQTVLLSSIGARLIPLGGFIPGTLAAREVLLRESGLDVTYLRPNGLMSNALLWADGIRDEKRVVDPTGQGTQPIVDPDDIARVAARSRLPWPVQKTPGDEPGIEVVPVGERDLLGVVEGEEHAVGESHHQRRREKHNLVDPVSGDAPKQCEPGDRRRRGALDRSADGLLRHGRRGRTTTDHGR